MLTANEIRDSFKSFFESKGHQIVPSAPMVIKDDPTLMFTNAGMNQFKDIILGNHPAKYKRKGDERTGLADKNSQLKTDSVILIFRTHTRKELEKGSFFIACI